MTTPHDATLYHDPSWSSPAQTKQDVTDAMDLTAAMYALSAESAADQYAQRAGVAVSYDDYPVGGTIAQVKDWVAGGDSTAWDYLTPDAAELARAKYAYADELAGEARVTLLGWLENIPGVEA